MPKTDMSKDMPQDILQQDKKRECRAWLYSFVVHIFMFLIACGFNVFAIAVPPEERPVDVTIYDADAGGGGGGSSAAAPAEAAPPPIPSIEDIVLEQKVKLPEIKEDFTQKPELQEKFKKEHNAPAAPAVTNAAGSGNAAGNGSGSGEGTGTGTGSGTGDGNGSGTGEDSGSGSGSGTGHGTGTGLRPAIPPQKIAGGEPVYPESLRARNVKGVVVVRISVNTSGTVDGVEIVSSSGHDAMDQAAINAAWGYAYTTAYNEYGEAVRFTKRIRMEFRLR